MALAEIVARKRVDVAARMAAHPLDSFREALAPSDRSLSRALTERGLGFILECKRSSPSQGLIRETFDPLAIARAYQPHASAISVLTDGPYFGGSFDDLRAVRERVRQPVLCKDFVVDPYQVFEARLQGADAVLLMLSVLDDDTYRRCADVVRQLGMEAITEVHDADEMARARALEAPIVGINNRDLKTLKVDLSVTERLAPLRPPGALLVSESGIGSHADVRRLRAHVDAFLVGTTLMRAPDLSRATRELLYGRVKVCGLTRAADAQVAAMAGATWGGLLLAPESPRFVALDQALAVREAEPALQWAGVFVNEAPARVAEAARVLSLDAVQLHGDEDAAVIAAVKAAVPETTEVWKAVRVRASIPAVQGADRVLLDAFSKDARGGTGRTFDWLLLEGVSDRGRLIVSGGLNGERALAADDLGAWALDLSSGVESAPGIKDPAKVHGFFAALRGRRETPR